MEKLQKAYKTIEMLESLGFSLSSDQMRGIAKMEREYLCEEVIPLLEGELLPLVEKMRTKFHLEVTYSPETGLDVNLIDRIPKQETLFQNETEPKRQKKYNIRVTFPDSHVSYNKMVWVTLMEVVRYACPEKVMDLDINVMGGNLVSSELLENERYRVGQKEVKPGLYLNTYSSTDTKYEQIKKINRSLNLGLIVEKVML